MSNKILFILLGTFSFLFAQAQEQTYNCFFQTNSAEYLSDSLLKLQNWLAENHPSSNVNFELIAFTDTIGSVEYNDLLAQKRLDKIAQVLKMKGYTVSFSTTIGKRYTTDNYSNNAAFRKVEIHFLQSKQLNDFELSDFEPVQEQIVAESYKRTLPQKNRMQEFEAVGNHVAVNLNIVFQNSSDVYKDTESEKQVLYLAEYLKKYQNKKVMILGHVCCANNLAVSNKRAKRVYDDLIKYKISKKRMSYKGMSNKYPLVEEIDAKTEQQNRRVEVVFYE